MHKVNDVAKHLGLSLSKVYELVDRGEIGHHRMDGAIRISEEQVTEYLMATKRERTTTEIPKSRPPRRRVALKHL